MENNEIPFIITKKGDNIELVITKRGETMLLEDQSTNNMLDTLNACLISYHIEDKTIFTGEMIPWEKEMFHKVNEWDLQDNDYGLINSFMKGQREFIFTFDKKSIPRQKEVTAKTAATLWVNYCQDPIDTSVLNVNERHHKLSIAHNDILEIQELFNYKNYKQDEEYFNTTQDVADKIKKEMDFCQQKLRVIQIISENNLSSSEIVNKTYQNFHKNNTLNINL